MRIEMLLVKIVPAAACAGREMRPHRRRCRSAGGCTCGLAECGLISIKKGRTLLAGSFLVNCRLPGCPASTATDYALGESAAVLLRVEGTAALRVFSAKAKVR